MTGVGGPGWGGIARIGLVQAAIGMVVVLTTSLLNRVMVVELGLAASVPGALVGLHYALQFLRPLWGERADAGRRTPWIVGGMGVLSLGGAAASAGVALMAAGGQGGMALTIAGFVSIGMGVGAAGTALLTLLAEAVAPERRAAAASVVWITMIVGFIVATVLASALLRPFTPVRLAQVGGALSLGAFLLAWAAIAGVEPSSRAFAREASPPLRAALAAVWRDPAARRFTLFVFLSMLAYSAQDLILEPFAGLAFRLAPAQTTALTSLQNGGVLAGMIGVALLGRRLGADSIAGMRRLTFLGCLGSAAALVAIAWSGAAGTLPALRVAIAALGLANGVFAVSAVGLMMGLAAGEAGGTGVRMGVWGAAQGIAFGVGGFAGTVAVDGARLFTGAVVPAYNAVFGVEALLFLAAAAMMRPRATAPDDTGLLLARGRA